MTDEVPLSRLHPTRYVLLVRKRIEVNTDPQRRCYNGAHAKSETVWTEWADIMVPRTKEDGEDSMAVFQKINPTRQYRLEPPNPLGELTWPSP